MKSEHDVFNFQECCIKEPGFVSISYIHFYICSLYMNTNLYRFLFLLEIYIYIQIFSSNISEYIISVAFSNTICGSSNFTCSNQSMYAYI